MNKEFLKHHEVSGELNTGKSFDKLLSDEKSRATRLVMTPQNMSRATPETTVI